MSNAHIYKALLLLSVLFYSLTQGLHAQTKYEREVRIETHEVQPQVLDFVKTLNLKSKVKWYREMGIDTTSIEAKTKYKGNWYSIEFSEDGTLEDIEIEVKWRDLDQQIANGLKDLLDSTFERYRIEKIQLQYIGAPSVMAQLFDTKQNATNLTLNYELVVSSKVEGAFKQFEFLFSQQPAILSKKEIISKNTVHIEY